MMGILVLMSIFISAYAYNALLESREEIEFIHKQIKDLDRSLDENIDYLEDKINKK